MENQVFYILVQLDLDENESYIAHNVDRPIPTRDGFYKLYRITLDPTEQVEIFYRYDEETNTLYKSVNGELETEVKDLMEIILVNPLHVGTNVTKFANLFVDYRQLYECYIDHVKALLDVCCGDKCVDHYIESQLIYERDFIWMTLEILKYLLQRQEIHRAGNLINRFIGCNNMCHNIQRDTADRRGCCARNT